MNGDSTLAFADAQLVGLVQRSEVKKELILCFSAQCLLGHGPTGERLLKFVHQLHYQCLSSQQHFAVPGRSTSLCLPSSENWLKLMFYVRSVHPNARQNILLM